MEERRDSEAQKPPISGDIGDLSAAAEARRTAAWKMSMSERLAQVHELSQQIDAIKGAARTR